MSKTTNEGGSLDFLTSPAAAMSRQAQTEATLNSVMESATRSFLGMARARALSSGLQLTAAQLHEDWQDLVWQALRRSPLTKEHIDYLEPDLRASEIPDDAYNSIRTVLSSAAAERWDDNLTTQQIMLALDIDSGDVEVGDSLIAASFWGNLRETGNTWITKIRRTVRTTSTGLDGWVTQSGIRVTGIPYKRWVTRHDENVRFTHAQVDGLTIPAEASFIVGGAALAYPGERGGDYQEIVNCRCVMVAVLRGQ